MAKRPSVRNTLNQPIQPVVANVAITAALIVTSALITAHFFLADGLQLFVPPIPSSPTTITGPNNSLSHIVSTAAPLPASGGFRPRPTVAPNPPFYIPPAQWLSTSSTYYDPNLDITISLPQGWSIV